MVMPSLTGPDLRWSGDETLSCMQSWFELPALGWPLQMLPLRQALQRTLGVGGEPVAGLDQEPSH